MAEIEKLTPKQAKILLIAGEKISGYDDPENYLYLEKGKLLNKNGEEVSHLHVDILIADEPYDKNNPLHNYPFRTAYKMYKG